MPKKKDELILALRIDEEGSQYKISGRLTIGLTKTLIGDLEIIKNKLIDDLEETQNAKGTIGIDWQSN